MLKNSKIKNYKIILLMLVLFISPRFAYAGLITNVSSSLGLSTGLVGHWTFDGNKIAGTSAYDSSSSFATGTISGATKTVGKIGQGLNFDGNDKITTGSDFIGTSAATFCAWNYSKIIAFNTTIVSNGKFMMQYSTNNRFLITSSNTAWPYSATNAVVLNKWQHICGTRDSNGIANIYVDGVLSGPPNQNSGTPTSGTTNVRFGSATNDTAFFRGLMDDIRVYNRVLSVSEIKRLYNIGAATKLATPSDAGSSLTNGLVGHWTFDGDKISGTSAYDSSSSFATGTITGATKTIGKLGQALKFNGTSDYVNIGTPASLNLNNNYTINFWVNLPSSYLGGAIRLSNNTSNTSRYDKYSIRFNPAYINFTTGNGTTGDDDHFTTVIPNNIWTMVTCSLDSQNNKTCYKNASFIASYTNDVDTSLVTPVVGYLGTIRNMAGNFMTGSLDDVRIYNRVLSVSEIKRLYNIGAATKLATPNDAGSSLTNGLVGHWTFDQKDIYGTTALDKSGNNNSGTITGEATKIAGKLGQALSFNGTSSYVLVGTPASLNNLTTMSISVWIKPNSFGGGLKGRIVDKDYDSTGWTFFTCDFIDEGCIKTLKFSRFLTGIPGERTYYSGDNLISIGKWQHVVVTHDGVPTDPPKFYANGVLSTSNILVTTGTGSFTNDSAKNLFIGGTDQMPRMFDGSIDDVRIYNRVLSADEVQRLYQMGR